MMSPRPRPRPQAAGWALVAALLAGACGEADMRSFSAENAIFEAIVLDHAPLAADKDTPESRAAIGNGLSAICKGDATGTRQLIREAGIGDNIYKLVLVAAKANRKGACDYGDWQAKQTLMGDRFKQLVGSGDPAAVLLAAMVDKSLAPADRMKIVEALAGRRYSHAEAIEAEALIGAANYPKALELLDDAAKQGATPADVLLARLHLAGQGAPKDAGKACKYLQDAANLGAEGAARELKALREAKTCP